MRKALVYVDAENVSIEEFQTVTENIRNDGYHKIIGKFYGNKAVLGGLIALGYKAGYEFIETSSMISGRKNVTDMKIVVDCITDVTELTEPAKVIIVSKDCDFIPLIYKLYRFNVEVETPLIDISAKEKTLKDLEEALREARYIPNLRQDILSPQYSIVRNILSEEYTDSLIEDWFNRKKNKFLKDIALLAGEVSEKIALVPAKDFSFITVCKLLGIPCDSEDGKMYLDVYTKRCFGFNYTASQREQILCNIC